MQTLLAQMIGQQVTLRLEDQLVRGEISDVCGGGVQLVRAEIWPSRAGDVSSDLSNPRSAWTWTPAEYCSRLVVALDQIRSAGVAGERHHSGNYATPRDTLGDPVELEIGIGLIPLADDNRGGDLLPRISGIRQAIAHKMGFIVPKIRVRDNMRLGEQEYRILIQGVEAGRGNLRREMVLALSTGSETAGLPDAERTRDPAFGQPAYWIAPATRGRAEMAGYLIVEPVAVLATHLQECLQRHAAELLSFTELGHRLETHHDLVLVQSLIPGMVSLGRVFEVLRALLEERVPIRSLDLILQAIGRHAAHCIGEDDLLAAVRIDLARIVCGQVDREDAHENNQLDSVELDEPLTEHLRDLFSAGRGQLSDGDVAKILQRLRHIVEARSSRGPRLVLVVASDIRRLLARLCRLEGLALHVLTHEEIAGELALAPVEQLSYQKCFPT